MTELQISKFFHFVGIGLIFTSLFGGLILTTHYRDATDYKTKATILRTMRSIGMVSPIAIVVMLVTGIGNWHAMGWFMEGWLHIKMTIYVIAAVLGVLFSIQAARRGKLIAALAQGNPPDGAEATVTAIDRRFRVFYIVQSALIFLLLLISIVKPGRYEE